MPAAGDVDHERPLVWLHEDPSGLGTGRVVGRRTAAMGTLPTAPGRLLHPLLTVVTFLHITDKHRNMLRETGKGSLTGKTRPVCPVKQYTVACYILFKYNGCHDSCERAKFRNKALQKEMSFHIPLI